jgi:hypothetical protein
MITVSDPIRDCLSYLMSTSSRGHAHSAYLARSKYTSFQNRPSPTDQQRQTVTLIITIGHSIRGAIDAPTPQFFPSIFLYYSDGALLRGA